MGKHSEIPTSETTHADFCAPNAAIQLPRGCWLPADSGFQPVAQHLTGVPFPLTWPDNTTIIVSTSCGGAVLHTIDILVEFCFQSCCCTVLVVVGGLVCWTLKRIAAFPPKCLDIKGCCVPDVQYPCLGTALMTPCLCNARSRAGYQQWFDLFGQGGYWFHEPEVPDGVVKYPWLLAKPREFHGFSIYLENISRYIYIYYISRSILNLYHDFGHYGHYATMYHFSWSVESPRGIDATFTSPSHNLTVTYISLLWVEFRLRPIWVGTAPKKAPTKLAIPRPMSLAESWRSIENHRNINPEMGKNQAT